MQLLNLKQRLPPANQIGLRLTVLVCPKREDEMSEQHIVDHMSCWFRGIEEPLEVKIRHSARQADGMHFCKLPTSHNSNAISVCIAHRRGLDYLQTRLWSENTLALFMMAG